MRIFFVFLALACAGTTALVPRFAHAQATMDQRALEPLQKSTPSPEPAKPAKPPHKHPAPPPPAGKPHSTGSSTAKPAAAHPNAASHPAAHAPATATVAAPTPPAVAHPAAVTAPAPPAPPQVRLASPSSQVRVPLGPPAAPVVPPPLIVPTRPPAPPPPAPVAADAPGAAAKIQDGLRITFGDGRADLNPGTESALHALAQSAPTGTSFTVVAFAPGAPEDPSTPRRLSLSRALTARSVLIAAGIPSVRVYVKALGASRGVEDGPADRVDVVLEAPNPQPPTAPAPTTPAANPQGRPAR